MNVFFATAASVSVSGRVATPEGRGIARAGVLMTDPDGQARTAMTNGFGYYVFTEVEAGRNYVLQVSSKTHQFSSQLLTVMDDVSNADFIALSGNRGK